MNFYNPYFYSVPAATSSGLLSRISFGSILNGATRVLNFANQAIPMFKQISPVVKNAKTMFKVMNEFRKNDTDTKTSPSETSPVVERETQTFSTVSSNGPTFFL